jgi:hypothetical protein
MRQDDTSARLEYIGPPAQQSGAAVDADRLSLVESPDADEQTIEAASRDDLASVASTTDDSAVSRFRRSDGISGQPAARSSRTDLLPADLEVAAAKDQLVGATNHGAGGRDLLDTSDVAASIDSQSGRVAGVDDVAGTEPEFVGDAAPEEMDQYRRIREADDIDALADHVVGDTEGRP